MFETFSIASLVDTARNYLTFRAGEIQLEPVTLHGDLKRIVEPLP